MTDTSPNLNALKHKLESPELYGASRGQLLPQAQKSYDAMAKKLGYEPEIFIDNTSNWSSDHVATAKLADGKRAVIVSENAHQWDEAFVQDKVLYDDTHFAKMKPYRNREVVKAYEALVKRAGIEPIPPLLEGQAEAHLSKSGKKYVSLEPNLPSDEALAVLAHELAHVKFDCTTASRAERHNHPERTAAREERADAFAVSLGLGRPLAKHMVGIYSDIKHEMTAKGKTVEDYEVFFDPLRSHPFLIDRIRAVVNGMESRPQLSDTAPPQGAQTLPGGTKPAEPTPPQR